jgi:hypothetical protein
VFAEGESALDGQLTANTIPAKKPVTAENLAAAAQASASPQLFRLYRACGTLCYTISTKGAAGLLVRCRPLQPLQVVMPEVRLSVPNRGIDLAMRDLSADDCLCQRATTGDIAQQQRRTRR